jgi:hypothetical protein
MCAPRVTRHTSTIFTFLPHTREHECIDVLRCCSCLYLALMVLSVSGRNVNYDEKQILGEKILSCSFCLYRFRNYVSYGFPMIIFVIPEHIMKRPVFCNKFTQTINFCVLSSECDKVLKTKQQAALFSTAWCF